MKIYLILLLGTLMAARASALVVTSGERVVIDHAVQGDIYITGGTVIVEAPVRGSLIVGGGTAIVRDTIMNDILMAGGELRFDGYVGGTIRCAGGRLIVNAHIGHDLVAAGGSIVVTGKGSVGGDLLATAGSMRMEGVVNGDETVRVGSFSQYGITRGTLDCQAEEIEFGGRAEGPVRLASRGDITIDNGAVFFNELRYWNPGRRLTGGVGLEKVRPVFDPALALNRGHWYYGGAGVVLASLWYLGMALVMIFVLQYLFERVFLAAGRVAAERAGRSFLRGLLFIVAVPVLAALCFVSFVGLPLGVLLLLGYVIVLVLAGVITALVAAYWLRDRTSSGWKPWQTSFVALGILIVLRLLAATPFFGLVICGVLACIAFGAVLQNIRWRKGLAVVA